MGKWIKANLVLIFGVTLPVLLVAGFFVLNRAPTMLVDAPEYDFLVVAYHYDHQHPRDFHLSLDVRNETLYAKVTPVQDDHTHLNRQYAGIFRYSAADNRFDQVTYDLPEGVDELQEPLEFEIEETRQLTLNKAAKSPDGFTFVHRGYRGRGGLLGEIFGMNRRRGSEYVLSKAGAEFELPKPTSNSNYNYYQHNLRFMGWIMAGGESP